MSSIPEVHIRKFEPKDRQAVRDIIYDCAFMGEPASVFFDGKELISDALSLYFTDFEPESAFVADDAGRVVGCLIGAKNKADSESVINKKIFPLLLRKAFISLTLFKSKNIRFIFSSLASMLKGELNMPDFNKEYPATLHINIYKEYRGFSVGARLMDAYIEYLKSQHVAGVHLATMTDKAAQFFSGCGFSLLFSGKRSYFRHIIGKDVPLYVYGKKL